MSDRTPLPGMPPRAIPLVVTRWKCPHCSFSRSRQAVTEAHIDRCWHNPANRGCRSCAHFEPAGADDCDCRPGCRGAGSWPDSCRLDQDLPDHKPITGCSLWEHHDTEQTL
ncbi:hypothetical protein [Nocardiopsis synnemataformans]|uniref:hypothetical protein n=1 Tax=Nocardiopsis synnemataformans TaxID=61305 RepID=UPI003EBEB8E4